MSIRKKSSLFSKCYHIYISIRHLAELIGKIIGYTGEFVFNSDRPDGTPRKLMDISILKDRDWTASISLEEGLRSVCEAYAMQM